MQVRSCLGGGPGLEQLAAGSEETVVRRLWLAQPAEDRVEKQAEKRAEKLAEKRALGGLLRVVGGLVGETAEVEKKTELV